MHGTVLMRMSSVGPLTTGTIACNYREKTRGPMSAPSAVRRCVRRGAARGLILRWARFPQGHLRPRQDSACGGRASQRAPRAATAPAAERDAAEE